MSVDEIIARRKLSRKRKRSDSDASDEEASDNESHDDDDLDAESDEEEEEDPLGTSDEEDGENYQDLRNKMDDEEQDLVSDGDSSSDESDIETQAEKDRKAAFFDSETAPSSDEHSSFLTMNLSRPLLKALSSMNFQKPTPIQAAAIPVALVGKDVVGNAVTGSGKTAAFIIPVLERLLYREKGKKAAATRCLVLAPTRELAVQSYDVGTKLGAHTDIQFCLIVGEFTFPR